MSFDQAKFKPQDSGPQQNFEDQLSSQTVSLIENPEEEFIKRDDLDIATTRKGFNNVQALLDEKMKRMEFEMEVLFSDQNERVQEALKENKVFNEDIPVILNQLEEYEITPEFLEVFEKTEQLEDDFQNDPLLVERQQSFQKDEKIIQESLMNIEYDNSHQALKTLDLQSLSSELVEQASRGSNSRSEVMFKIMKTMGLFKLKIDYEGWLNLSRSKGRKSEKELSYEEFKKAERIDLKIDGIEAVEMMIFGLNLLMDNCLEKVSCICLSSCGRFISNEEAKRFKNYAAWGERKIKLTVDFTDCTFEDEDTPLIFFSSEELKLENFEAFKYFLKNTNATQKTVDGFSKLIESRMGNLERLGFDFCNLPITVPVIYETLLNKASGINKLDFAVQKTAFGDDELIYLSEKVLPELKGLQELKLWLDQTLVTDKGLLSLFKSIRENCAGHLTAFILGVNENDVSDQSIGEFALNVMPLMENLEEFRLLVEKTEVTDKTMISVGENIKYFAGKLKIFGMEVAYTAVTDEAMNALAFSVSMMKKIEYWNFWFCSTKITDKGLINLYSAIDTPGVFDDLLRFELDCSETAATDESLMTFAQKPLLKMKKLKKFVFYANKIQGEDSRLAILFQNLSACKAHLSDLTLSFDETEIGERCIFALATALSSIINLENLNLWFNQTKVENPSVESLCASLEISAKNLECLSLGFDNTKVTDEGMRTFASEMKSLKEFRFWVAGTQVGDPGVTPLFENLKKSRRSLQDLQLCLNNTLVSDQSLFAFVEENSVSRAESLKSVELWLPNTDLSDLSLAPLFASLENSVPDVNKLVLSFKETKIGSWTMNVLGKQVISNMRNLQHLQLFLGQSQITNPSMITFFENIANKVQNIRRFELEMNDQIDDETIRKFADKVLPNLVRVKDFKLTWSESLGTYTFDALCLNARQTIKNIKTFDIRPSSFVITTGLTASLQELSFEFNSMTDGILEEILESFEDQVSQVKTFSLLVKGTQVSDRSLKALANICFSFMPNLESLSLNFDELDFSDEAFCEMCRSFEQFAGNLKHFKLNLGQVCVSDISISTLAESGLAYMTNLETLNLDFYYNGGIEQGLIPLFTKMQNCTQKVQSLSLSIPGIKLLPEAVQAFSNCIFPSLKSFQLGIYETGINDADFALLFSGFKDVLENIKYFALGIYEETLTGQALDMLSSDILPRLINIETFRYYLANNQNITDESFIRLNRKLQEVSSKIEFLIFRFENVGITNEGVNEFALKTLREMKNLKDADISFGYNAGLGDEAFVNLFDGLGEIVGSMNSLQLNLQSTGLTDVGIERFREKMGERVEHLEKFTMDITENNISEENKKFIGEITHS